MIILICGMLGSGKTLLQIILGHIAHKKGLKVLTTVETTYGENFNPIEIMDFELSKCVLLLDEVYTIIDSRNPQQNKLTTYFFLQSRKRDVHIIATAQLVGSTDIRFREIADVTILAEKVRKNKKIVGFNYTVFFGANPSRRFFLRVDKAKEYYDYYDTSKVIYPFELLGKTDTISFDEIKELFEESPTKKAFVTIMKRVVPFVSLDTIMAVYDWLKVGKESQAKKILRFA